MSKLNNICLKYVKKIIPVGTISMLYEKITEHCFLKEMHSKSVIYA